MRFMLLLALTVAMIVAPRPVAALSVCPTSQIVLRYGDGAGASLNEDQRETIEAMVARARSCNVQSFSVFANASDPEQSLWRGRIDVVRDELISRGVDGALIAYGKPPGSERYADTDIDEAIVVMVYFR